VTALVKGLAEGTWAYQKDEPGALAVLAKFLGVDASTTSGKATLERSFTAYLPPVQAPPGRCHAADFTPYVHYQPAEEQAALGDLGPLFDNSYVDALDKQGFYAGLQRRYGPLPNNTGLTQVLR
jgi:hypothetical protein